jgi:RimJ/RimL family protein N-acetyltransferase
LRWAIAIRLPQARSRDAVGQKVATHATALTLNGERDFWQHRVIAELDARNEASVALCGRLGMREEANFIEDLWFKGALGR